MTEPALDGLLDGETAIVTGAAQGNGKAIAMGLARAGAKVALCDVQADPLSQAAEAIARETGARVHAATLDVTDREACAGFVAAASDALGPVSILVNNAGVIARNAASEADFTDQWDRIFSVNVSGARNMTLAALDDLKKTRGRIVNLGSIMSFRGGTGISAYAASKGAIAQMTRSFAVEFAPHGIRVNALAPGVIATPMTEQTRANPDAIGKFMAHTPMGRVGEVEELVGPVLFLASGLSSYVTGAILPVDGGYLAV